MEDVASAISIPVNTLLAAVQTTDRLTVVDGDLDLTVCSDSVTRTLDRWCNDVVRAVGCPVHIDELAELLTVHLGKTSASIASSIKASAASTRSGLGIWCKSFIYFQNSLAIASRYRSSSCSI